MYKDNEPSFPSLYRLFEIANEYDKDYSKEFGDELKSYVDLLNAINKLEPSRVTSSELSKIISQFDQLSLPKEEIKKRIAFLIENAKKVGIRFDQVESKDKYIDNLLKATTCPRCERFISDLDHSWSDSVRDYLINRQNQA